MHSPQGFQTFYPEKHFRLRMVFIRMEAKTAVMVSTEETRILCSISVSENASHWIEV